LDLHALGKGEAWIDAIAQIFFGLSICCGAMPVSVLHSRAVSFSVPDHFITTQISTPNY
jgi:SNF family Na+-dependent transporter